MSTDGYEASSAPARRERMERIARYQPSPPSIEDLTQALGLRTREEEKDKFMSSERGAKRRGDGEGRISLRS